jgi:hypothetical protein
MTIVRFLIIASLTAFIVAGGAAFCADSAQGIPGVACLGTAHVARPLPHLDEAVDLDAAGAG